MPLGTVAVVRSLYTTYVPQTTRCLPSRENEDYRGEGEKAHFFYRLLVFQALRSNLKKYFKIWHYFSLYDANMYLIVPQEIMYRLFSVCSLVNQSTITNYLEYVQLWVEHVILSDMTPL